MTQHRKGAINFTLRVLCLLVALACAAMLVWQIATRIQGERAGAAMRSLYYGASAEAAAPAPQESFSQLLSANAETVGWLSASDSIDFAIVQRDNEYYLTHNFFGEQTAEGTAFMDAGNSVYPLDEHILIHGHNMRDGSVFGDLDLFRDLDYLKENAVATFNTIYENAQYVPIAVFDISATPGDQDFVDMQTFNFDTDEDFLNFVNEARARSIFDIPVEVERGDRLLSLVTCSYNNDNGRLVVMLRALREGETAQEMTALVAQATQA
ncbi:MAG TPA: class B sortase [Candidatus Pullichristensenella avicola]|nr:class B sortase [Candidatus Pullichristensenella avicola]